MSTYRDKCLVIAPDGIPVHRFAMAPGDATWSEGTLTIQRRTFPVRFARLEPALLAVRPLRPYNSAAFKEFFGFGSECGGYDETRVTTVPGL
jgi:hypothetical protein